MRNFLEAVSWSGLRQVYEKFFWFISHIFESQFLESTYMLYVLLICLLNYVLSYSRINSHEALAQTQVTGDTKFMSRSVGELKPVWFMNLLHDLTCTSRTMSIQRMENVLQF